MTAVELAERLVIDIASAVRSGEWTALKEHVILALASAFDTIARDAYERGVKDGQALAVVDQYPKGE